MPKKVRIKKGCKHHVNPELAGNGDELREAQAGEEILVSDQEWADFRDKFEVPYVEPVKPKKEKKPKADPPKAPPTESKKTTGAVPKAPAEG